MADTHSDFWGFNLTPGQRINLIPSDPAFIGKNKLCFTVFNAFVPPTDQQLAQLKNSLSDLLSSDDGKDISEMYACLRWEETGLDHSWHHALYKIAKEFNLLNHAQQLVIYQNVTELVPAHPGLDVRALPRFLITSWIQYYGADFQWNPHGKGCLYLPGKLYKMDRLVLIKKIVEDPRLRELIEFNFRYDIVVSEPENLQRANDIMISYKDPNWCDFRQWGEKLHNEVDLPKGSPQHIWYAAYLPRDILSNKLLLLVTESFMDQPKFITEKTFNAICLGMPFIVLNDSMAVEINNMGFKTYNELLGPIEPTLPINEYCEQGKLIRDYFDYHVDIMLDRVTRFCDQCSDPNFVVKVKDTIEHNKQRARDIVVGYQQEYNEYLWLPLNDIWHQDWPPMIFNKD